jgi:tetratricopeptide (TPR) repeat protein
MTIPTLCLFLFGAPLQGTTQMDKGPYGEVIGLIKEKDFQEALSVLEGMKGVDPSSADHLALKGFLYAQLGERKAKAEEQQEYFQKGHFLAEEAIERSSGHAFAHFAKAMALGRMVEDAAPAKKIERAREIKEEAERAIELDSNLAGPYHILGRWHKKIAGLSNMERWSADLFLGGLPQASYEQAIQHFEKAADLEPKEPLHFFEMGLTYEKMGKAEKGLEMIRKAQRIAKEENDEEILEKCRDRLSANGE